MKRNIRLLGKVLAYMERGRKYVGIMNSLFIFVIFLQSFDMELRFWVYPALLLTALFLYIFVGWVDTVLGIRKMEALDNEENLPMHMEIRDNVRKILSKV